MGGAVLRAAGTHPNACRPHTGSRIRAYRPYAGREREGSRDAWTMTNGACRTDTRSIQQSQEASRGLSSPKVPETMGMKPPESPLGIPQRNCVGCDETAPAGASRTRNRLHPRWGNRRRGTRREGATAAPERRGVPTRTRTVVPGNVLAASAASAARIRPRLHRSLRIPMTAKPATATCATATAMIVTSADADASMRSMARRQPTGRAVAIITAAFITMIAAAMASAARSAREDGGAAASPSARRVTGRAAVPVPG